MKIFLILLLISFVCHAEEAIYLSIENAQKIAVQNNDILKSESYSLRQAETYIEESFSYFMPKIGFMGVHVLHEKPVMMQFPSVLPGQPAQEFEMGLTPEYLLSLQFHQPIYTGGRIYYNWEISRLNTQMNIHRYQEVREELILQVKSSYFLCIVLKETLKAIRDGIDLSKKHFDQVDLFYQTGQATYQEWLRARVQLSALGPELHQAESNYSNSINNLKLLLGIDEDKVIRLTTQLELNFADIDEAEYRDKISNNPGIMQFEKANKIAELNKKIAKADYLPTVSLSMDYSMGSDNFSLNSKYWKDNYSISLNIQFSIFDGFARRARKKRAYYEGRGLEHQAIFYENRLKLMLESVFDEIETARKRVIAYENGLEDAEESVRVSNLYYQEGLINSFEVNAVSYELTRARLNYLNAVYDYFVSVFKLQSIIPEIEK